jgi:outer membrane receptor protein involved in Fe transport
VPDTVGPDYLINYELGVKSTFCNDRAHVEFDVYHIDWKNIQLTATAPSGVTYLANGGRSISRGLELASHFQLLDHLSLAVNAAYNDAHLKSVIADANFLRTGYQLPNAPKETASATVNYDLPLQGAWQARFGAAFRYVGWQWLGLVESASPATTPTVRAPGYGAFDFNASLRYQGYTLSAYARNVTNRLAITGASQQNLVVINSATGATQINTTFLQPRTIGLSLDYAF